MTQYFPAGQLAAAFTWGLMIVLLVIIGISKFELQPEESMITGAVVTFTHKAFLEMENGTRPEQLIMQGEAAYLSYGTSVSIISFQGDMAILRVSEGEYQGQVVYAESGRVAR